MPGPFCPSCSYDLQAQLTKWGARCPECGRGYTVEELERYAQPWPWRPIVKLTAIILAPPILVIAMIWFALVTWFDSTPWWYTVLFWTVLGGVPIAHQVIAMRWCDRNNWPYLFGAFIGVALTLTSVAIFYFLAITIASILVAISYR